MKIKTKNRTVLFLIWVPFLTLLSLGFSSLQKNQSISSWLPYWQVKNGLELLNADTQKNIKSVNLFLYVLDKEGNIKLALKEPKQLKQIIDTLSRKQIKIVVTFTNDVFYSPTDKKIKDADIMHKILNDQNLRQKHIKQILEISQAINAQAIDIDYENLNISDKNPFMKFIKELSSDLQRQEKELIVTVAQKTKNHKRSWAGVMNWKEISEYADMIIIMCYNYSSKLSGPGPICPLPWLRKIINFAKSQIPINKISIALGLHGYDWSQKNVTAIDIRKAKALIKIYKARIKWDKKSHTPHFQYRKDGAYHQVWFENQKSILEKIRLVKKYKIKHLALWHLGILDEGIYETLKNFLLFH